MITGPRHTPYAFGCFVFDVFLPLLYPSCPPLVWNLTTGDGTVRYLKENDIHRERERHRERGKKRKREREREVIM